MSLFFRSPPPELRQWTADPPLNPQVLPTFGAPITTPEAGLQKVAVWAAVNLLASLCSSLPLKRYRGDGDARQQLPLTRFLTDPAGDGYGVSDWLYQLFVSLLLHGNVVGQVLDRDPGARPTQVFLLGAGEASGWRHPETGRIEWRIRGKKANTAEIWHQRAYPLSGQLMGLSPIAQHALTIGQGLSAARFGAQWFADGAHPSGILTNEEQSLSQDQAKTAKHRFVESLRGRREPAVLGRGWKYQQVQVDAEESQFLLTQGYTAAECARIYGPGLPEILGYETGGSMTYANVEQRGLDLLTYTLDPWLSRAERWLSATLPSPQYVRFERNALLRMITLDRFRAHALALANRWQTVNEVRRIEDQPPVPWGDEPNEQTPTPKEDPDAEQG